MASCAEIPGKTGTNASRAVAVAPKDRLAKATMTQTNEPHVLFRPRAQHKGCSKESVHQERRLSSPIRFNSRRSPHWNMKTCWSRRRQAAAKRGLRERKSGGFWIAGGARGTHR